MSNRAEEFAMDKEHLGLVDRYYKICEVFGDDLNKVAIAIRQAGAEQRPSFIKKDIEYLWIDKYANQINYIHDMFTYDHRFAALFCGVLNSVCRIAKKGGMDPIHEVRKGEILEISHENIQFKPKDKKDSADDYVPLALKGCLHIPKPLEGCE